MKKPIHLLYLLISVIIVSCSSIDEITIQDVFDSKLKSFDDSIESFKKDFNLPQNTKLSKSYVDTLTNTNYT